MAQTNVQDTLDLALAATVSIAGFLPMGMKRSSSLNSGGKSTIIIVRTVAAWAIYLRLPLQNKFCMVFLG